MYEFPTVPLQVLKKKTGRILDLKFLINFHSKQKKIVNLLLFDTFNINFNTTLQCVEYSNMLLNMY